jgi:hypothetical protein
MNSLAHVEDSQTSSDRKARIESGDSSAIGIGRTLESALKRLRS